MIKFITALLLLFSCVLRAQNITYVEYFFDSDPGFNNAASISFSASPTVSITSHSISTAALGGGFHTFYLRAKDQNGNWSVLNAKSFYKTPSGGSPLANIERIEYFIDDDPGFGNASEVTGYSQDTVVSVNSFTIPIGPVNGGFHTLYVRARDVNKRWSVLTTKPFYKTPSISDPLANVVKLEYFIDKDPGFGNAGSIPISPGGTDINENHVIDLSGVTGGFHTLYLRAKDADNNWTVLNAKAFYKTPGGGPALPNVTKLEYFIDNDPGFGVATNVPITLSDTNVIQNGIVADITSVAGGFHTLYVRAKDANGNWSVLNAKAFYKTPSISDPLANVIKMEYFIDKDPGFGNADSIPVSPGTDISKNHVIDLSAVSGGFHTLYLRAKDSDNNWSTLNANAFYKTPASSPAAAPIVAVEYYFIKTGFTSSVNVFDQFTKSTNVQLTFSPLFTGLDVDSVYNLRVYAKDSTGRRSLEYDTSLTVNAAWLVTPNNKPFVARSLSDQTVSEDFGNLAVANLDTIFSDSDIPGGDSLRYSVSVTNPIVNAVISNKTLTLNSIANLNGNTLVIVTATDDSGATAKDTFAVTIQPMNDAPVAVNDNSTATAGVAKVISVLNNDSDIDGDGLTITSVSTPLHGTAVKNAGDTTITYTALITYSGSDQFTYSISDGQGGLDTATVSITVTPGGTLALSTSVLQNPALSKYADFYVISDTTLTGVPAVKLFVGTDSTAIAMSATSNVRIYKGAITFTQSGNYTLRSQAIAVNGAGNTDYHAFNVALSKPGLSAMLSSVSGKALLKLGTKAVKEETYFTAFENTESQEMIYEFGPKAVLSEAVELTVTQVYTRELKVVTRTNTLGQFKLGYDASYEGTNIVPAVFALKQNYPNPFNPSTTISYDVPEDTKLNLTIYNLLGQKVRTLVSGSQIAGSYKTLWNGTNDRGQTVASGIYFYRLETQSFIKTQKMLLIK